MSPTAPTGELRAWIEHHLDPLEEGQSSEGASDFDLGANAFPNEPVELTPAAVLVGLIEREYGFSVLLTRRADTLRRHTGQIALPGGKLDPEDADATAAALREAQEEVGLNPAQVEVLGTMPPHRTVTNYAMIPVLALVHGPFTPIPEPGEVEEVFTVPFAHIANPAHYRIEGRIWRGARRSYYVAPWGPYYIWGATARVLHSLAQRLAA